MLVLLLGEVAMTLDRAGKGDSQPDIGCLKTLIVFIWHSITDTTSWPYPNGPFHLLSQ